MVKKKKSKSQLMMERNNRLMLKIDRDRMKALKRNVKRRKGNYAWTKRVLIELVLFFLSLFFLSHFFIPPL